MIFRKMVNKSTVGEEMFYIAETNQKTYQIGDVTFGGQPGIAPPVLLGGMFQPGDKNVLDHTKGIIDEKKVLEVMHNFEESCTKVGLPFGFSCNGGSSEGLIKYIDFVAEHFQGPIGVDAMNDEMRLPGIQHAVDIGLNDRAIYISCSRSTTPQQMKELVEIAPKNVVIRAENVENMLPQGRIEILEGDSEKPGLLSQVQQIKDAQIMLDPSFMGSAGMAYALAAIPLLRNQYGFPVGGCAMGNWGYFRNRRKEKGDEIPFGGDLDKVLSTFFQATTALGGLSYILVSPKQLHLPPTVSIATGIMAYNNLRLLKKKPRDLDVNHPVRKYLS
jgi:tetrahydromethanopterin S-methyltransferase subunit H